MAALATKIQLLDDGGYRYNFDREIYFNRKTKKAFSVDFVDDMDDRELQKAIQEKNETEEWRFYFTSPPSLEVIRELERVLG